MCTGEVERKVWMRLRSAGLIASAQRSMSLKRGAREPADDRVLGALGDLVDGGEVAVRRDRKAGLDDVDAHVVEQFGDFELFLVRHGGAGTLLAVAQGGVEDDDAVLFGFACRLAVVMVWSFSSAAPAGAAGCACGRYGVGPKSPLSAQAQMPSRPSGAGKEQQTTKNEGRTSGPSRGGSPVDRIDIVANRHARPRSAMVAENGKGRVNPRGQRV